MNKFRIISILVISLMLYSAKIGGLFQNNVCLHKIYADCPLGGEVMYAERSSKNVPVISEVRDSSRKISTKKRVQKIDDSEIFIIEEFPSVYFFKSGMQIDADGAPKAYHKDSSLGLDHLKNAGKKGNWWGIVTTNGKSGGIPAIQDSDDPAPGYYVAGTSLQDGTKKDADPDRYVDSAEVPYIALPSGMNFPLEQVIRIVHKYDNICHWLCFCRHWSPWEYRRRRIALAEAVGISNDRRGRYRK